jgi:transcriptional regulator with XRE-family HTH domain
MEHSQAKSSKFATRLKIARDNAHLTQVELANELQVSKQTVWRWETEQGEPTVSQLLHMATMFRCAPSWLMGASDGKVPEWLKSPSATKVRTIIERLDRLEAQVAALTAAEGDAEAVRSALRQGAERDQKPRGARRSGGE